ncbi:ErpL protein [Bacillus wiedmannii]|nr:ErpL protein [Bacillus wiedmannii]PEG10441.1 ErpL protein [Bacillus wiedmannii]PEI74400.1 ErpL protein [Bacillus wiedmannii]PEJ53040.1 ErpL protein [Bacillus wiedmannii]PEO17898.1 ErpL protein [Bacillus wiedmannii]
MGEIKMLKTPRKLKKMLILPCMCSITFYLGSQIMTYTEAAFIHETKVEAALSTAIIFPKTVDTLKEEAEKHKQFIEHQYGEMKGKLAVTSREEIEQAIVVWQQGREKIASEEEALQNVYTAIETPYNQIQEELKVNKSESIQQVAVYVNEGFLSIKEKRDYIVKEVSLQAIDEQIQTLQKLLKDETVKKQNEIEEQKKVEEQKQVETAKKLEQGTHEKATTTDHNEKSSE